MDIGTLCVPGFTPLSPDIMQEDTLEISRRRLFSASVAAE
jgi:hypothetical protein